MYYLLICYTILPSNRGGRMYHHITDKATGMIVGVAKEDELEFILADYMEDTMAERDDLVIRKATDTEIAEELAQRGEGPYLRLVPERIETDGS
jgi:hypothetical protein